MQTDIDLLTKELGDRYRVERLLGSGGAAHVYLCRDLETDEAVALKLLRKELQGTVAPRRFEREVGLAASLAHPNLLPLLDSGDLDGRLYFVVPYVGGDSLQQRIKREGPLPIDLTLRIAADVGRALEYAHGKEIVHRDVKPSNILLAGDTAVLADFGVARATDLSASRGLTATGAVVGTPSYMSPEQLSGSENVGPRSDVYSMACVVYEMLTGEPPFSGADLRSVAARHLTQSPPPVRGFRAVPAALENAVLKGLAKAPADRYPSVAAFVDALEHGIAQREMRVARGTRLGLVALVAVAAVWTTVVVAGPGPRDPNRIAVFPIVENTREGDDSGVGERLATYLGYMLEGTDPLQWEEARDWLTAAERASPSAIAIDRKAQLSRAAGVGRFLDGDILRAPDSIRVVMRLYDASDGSLQLRQGAAGPADASEAALAVRAVTAMLAELLGDRPLEVETLSAGDATAVARFHLDELAFRENRLSEALAHYREALRNDSTFALAALKGGLAAHWLNLEDETERLIRTAARRGENLPTRFLHLARGMIHSLDGDADAAVRDLREGLRLAPEWAEGSMVLGEIYYHMQPSVGPLDSLAKAAYRDALRFDPEFKVPLIPLAQFALWDGDVDSARALLAQVGPSGRDTPAFASISLLATCMGENPGAVDWSAEIDREPSVVLTSALLGSVGGRALDCTEAATRSLLRTATPTNESWGAFLLLQNALAAQGRYTALADLMVSPSVAGLPTEIVYLFDAAAGHPVLDSAAPVASELWTRGEELRTPQLWALGVYAAAIRDLDDLATAIDLLRARASESEATLESQLLDLLTAQQSAVSGSATALDSLQALHPFGNPLWDLWGGLALERVMLAETLMEQGRFAEASVVARELESHRSAFNLLVLPRSLAVRAAASEALGRTSEAAAVRMRLRSLRLDAASPVTR